MFFNKKVAADIVKNNTYPDIIFARNVIPHVKEIHSVIDGISTLMNKGCVGAIEFHDAKIIFR